MTINRYELVNRHNVVLNKVDILSPLSIGNGEIAFTADITGMQTFSDEYKVVPLCTMVQWGFHTIPAKNEEGFYTIKDLKLKYYNTYGRKVGYATLRDNQEEIFDWLRVNPHRFHLGNIGLNITLSNGDKAKIECIEEINQTLDLWNGILTSEFKVEGIPVIVKTLCHPEKDIIAISVKSDLIKKGRLSVDIKFPYGSPEKSGADWTHDELHNTDIIDYSENIMDLMRTLDRDFYFVRIGFSDGVNVKRKGKNYFTVSQCKNEDSFNFSCLFSKSRPYGHMPLFEESENLCKKHWRRFWNNGGAIDFSKCTDNRAFELERRVVLSQYLTAIQCSGSMPPQETGLTCNSWYGKFHLEMHLWHVAHFALWGRTYLLRKSMWWYKYILHEAKNLAKSQGYKGARWPKMVGPNGIDSPSSIGPLLIWQQPHPIMYGELIYRDKPCPETLDIFKDIVFETADFLASYTIYDKDNDRYVLGPPLIPVQENHDPDVAINPTFELEYFSFALQIANNWRLRMGLSINPIWQQISEKMASLPVKDGVYLSHERCSDTFTKFNFDHPSMLGALGVLPGHKVDKGIMKNTLNKVLDSWQMEEMWGWDFPMIAMTAARLEEPEIAVDVLLMECPKNTYMPNGHNSQIPNDDLPVYLPGNGGLLTAVAMMASGWDGCHEKNAPGFPRDGKWNVEWEGLEPMM
ncbi:glycoside hydrolase family 65 [Thermoanaerobacterium sp. RBIITD]|uniref:glycoside hydrolase family 65 n=1 Tax=Thermoanaerobacterium sp. RBIITD TaxID=1550240 RepID=UPI000BB92086|nr:glycoside hydrolase family 65 [Thermoanaerobacterium sp. RBIITD]SNX53419.1 hypothetical protein SAMN05660242_0962 [Thermoanaerobacterium sp. RBIITD]